MKLVTLDVETTISNKGNPFDSTNKLISIGVKPLNGLPTIYYAGLVVS